MKGHILITGGSGSLGQAILARAASEGWEADLVVYSRDEVKQAALAERYPFVRFLLGDVQDADALGRAMRGIDTVIHAAAYKRVPEAERETLACVGANVIGSANVVREAIRADVVRVVGISTDKACAPINAYGQSKALMERLFQSVARMEDGPAFSLVRYGNVLASRGSVIPTLQAQAARGGPITLTDPDMTRFWLTLDDAVDLVVQASTIFSGDVLIPACPAASMRDVAEAVAPGMAVAIIGGRGGEKRHEQLLNVHEAPYAYAILGGWSLRSLASSGPLDHMPDGFAYGSDTATRITPDELRDVIAKMAADEPVRLLS